MLRRLAFPATACCFALLLACQPETTRMEPVRRFARDTGVEASADRSKSATLGAETRTVLAGYHTAVLTQSGPGAIEPGQQLSFDVPVPPRLRGERQILTQVVIGDPTSSRELRSRLVPVKSGPAGETIQLEFQVPKRPKSARLRYFAAGTAVPETAQRTHRTGAIEIASGSRLEFGLGLLSAAAQGPVQFQVSACEADVCTLLFDETVEGTEKNPVSWQDRDVPLSEYAGRDISLEFTTTLLREDADLPSLPIWSEPILWSPVPRLRDDVNVILISIDTLGARHLPAYGYELDTAPFLQQHFGETGLVFENLVAAAPMTAPAHMSIFTSVSPVTHGVHNHRVGGIGRLSHGIRTLAELLQDAGVSTAAFTENGAIMQTSGFSRGFDVYAEDKSPNLFLPRGQIQQTLERARAWLIRNADRRFFLFLHTYQVHYPYSLPAAYKRILPGPAPGSSSAPKLPKKWEPLAYDREIRYTDDQLRVFFSWLEENGFSENTVVVLTSDHGEEFGEHGHLAHGATLHAEVTHVPLMLSGPGIPSGQRRSVPVSHLDLMPTILDFFQIPVPEQAQGRSLRDEILEDDPTPALVPIYSETQMRTGRDTTGQIVRIQPPRIAVRLGDRKLVRSPAGRRIEYQYFNLLEDPEEKHDLYPEHQDEASDLVRLLANYTKRGQQLQRTLAEAADAESQADADPEAFIDPEHRRKLRALGYVD
ncbi:MAG: sulfatase [Myxococcota bacterium]|nr:sulfatase [Myxococcota bacterium]